ncbi:hypothetical protein HYN36_17385 [Vibrio parahaemolyticus]|nr:hypothetical protein [Vibrio parahaemolyticus]MBM5311774.1 hypothetical protein [Vibrio parahaemolyticus]MBM5336193.1 hypothetical protein [Vibrio parahaemolyticus]MCF9894196.1 hypothetical protein [Vibrio parahaemolyticus]MCF9915227.1 hypothetical protein [Vibrio parahaemolyticus]
MKKVERLGLKNITSKCVIDRQENYRKREGQLIEKVEIKNRVRFEKVDQKVKPKSRKLFTKKLSVVE